MAKIFENQSTDEDERSNPIGKLQKQNYTKMFDAIGQNSPVDAAFINVNPNTLLPRPASVVQSIVAPPPTSLSFGTPSVSSGPPIPASPQPDQSILSYPPPAYSSGQPIVIPATPQHTSSFGPSDYDDDNTSVLVQNQEMVQLMMLPEKVITELNERQAQIVTVINSIANQMNCLVDSSGREMGAMKTKLDILAERQDDMMVRSNEPTPPELNFGIKDIAIVFSYLFWI